MIIPVRCFSCNNEIGNKYELYILLSAEVQTFENNTTTPPPLTNIKDFYVKVMKETDEEEDNSYITEYKRSQIKGLYNKFNSGEIPNELRDVLESITQQQKKVEFLNMLVFIMLDIENYCCNRHLISHIELINEIN